MLDLLIDLLATDPPAADIPDADLPATETAAPTPPSEVNGEGVVTTTPVVPAMLPPSGTEPWSWSDLPAAVIGIVVVGAIQVAPRIILARLTMGLVHLVTG